MLRAGPDHALNRRRTRTTRLETLLEEVRQGQERVLQGQQAMTKRLTRIEGRVNERHAGGSPPKIPWRDYYLEALRLERFAEEGIQDRDHLQQHLLKWSADQSSEPPDERTIRREVAKIAKALNLA
jgi:hypothetical protein